MCLRFACLTFLLGCPNPNPTTTCDLPDEPPTATRVLEIGDPFGAFRPYTMDRVVSRVFGPQGGSHINIGFRVPAEPTDGEEERCMQVSYSSTNAAGETFRREGGIGFERQGEYWVSRSSITDTSMDGTSIGTATLVDALFTATASVQIFAVYPEDDAGVIDAPPIDLALGSTAFGDMDPVPLAHQCAPPRGTGENQSPPLSWSAGPPGTQSFAVTMRNTELGTLGWVLYDLPASTTSLAADVPLGYEVLDGAHQADVAGAEDVFGFVGPCLTGSYEIAVHALDVLELPDVAASPDARDVVPVIERYTIARSAITFVMP